MAVDPTEKNAIYLDKIEEWTQNTDFAEMSLSILRDGDYLDEFGGKAAEAASQYNLRKKMSMQWDLCPDLIDMRVQELWRTSPARDYEGSKYKGEIEAFIADVDGGGTSIDGFMRDVTRLMHINGVDVLVDRENTEGIPVSRADEKGKAIVTAYTPSERFDWDTDHAGNFNWVRFDAGSVGTTDETQSGGAQRYITYTKNLWRVYLIDEDGKQAEEVAEGAHSMGIVPVVPIYWAKSVQYPNCGVAMSLMSRLSPISRYMLNLTSQGQLDLYLSVCFLVASGVEVDQLPSAIGASTLMTLSDPSADLKPVFTQTDHIKEKANWLNMATLAQLRIGKVLGLAASLEGRAQSGVQVAMEASPLHSELSATAKNLESSETEIVRLAVSRARGELIDRDDLGYSVKYNDRFTLQSATDLIKQASDLAKIPNASELSDLIRIYLRKILDHGARQGSKEYEDADEQLKNFTADNVNTDIGLDKLEAETV
ncbi:MAG: hypothetical protein GY807_18910 [Gammaproteobacteria bacterium]|nr:hypothetical protein [Gammaproteobacteria bacterium]